MNTIGMRLKQERKRLGMTQPDFALVGGVEKGTQINYEQDKRFPDVKYLLVIAAIGIDTHYILHGEPSQASLTKDEAELLFGYRALDVRGKVVALGMIETLKTPPAESKSEKQGQFVNTITGTGKKAQLIQGSNISTGKTINKVVRKKKDAL
jgi:transcriptional regulator with XRE-family HTH domain